MDVYTYNIFKDERYLSCFFFIWCSSFCSSVALHKCAAYISSCLALCSVVCEGILRQRRVCCCCFIFASCRCFMPFFLSSGWLFGVYFSRVLQLYVIVQIHNEVGTNGTPCTHANVPRVKCAVVIFFTGWMPLFFFHSFESIKYEICFYSFGGYWTIVTAAEVTAFRGRWFLRAFATSKFKINTTNYFQ